MSPNGGYDTVIDAVAAQLRQGPYLLGERFTAADILWGMALSWTTIFKVVPERPEIMAYIARIRARPPLARVQAIDAKLADGVLSVSLKKRQEAKPRKISIA
jgi:glutathione S-transferase